MRRFLFVLAAVIVGAAQSASAATFTVTTTANDGAGSLRVAIQSANTNGGPDDIRFAIPAMGVQTINLLSALPAITGPLVIDGYTQPGSMPNSLATGNNAVLLIEIRGNSVSDAASGLVVTTGPVTIRGLVIGGFPTNGISLENAAGGNVVEGCFIGTDATGATANLNAGGIRILGPVNIIGGADVSKRNVLIGNTNPVISGSAAASGNLILGNYAGTNAAGTATLGQSGIVLTGPSNVVGGITAATRNVIACIGRPGIFLSGTSANQNVVAGNYIGLTADGTAALAQDNSGVNILDGSNNRIGGDDADDGSTDGVVASRNVIVAKGAGVQIGGLNIQPTNNVIRGNYIGTAADGATPLPSGTPSGFAVFLSDAVNTTVGGPTAGAANVLAHFFNGVDILGTQAGFGGGNIVQGNYIGTNAASATTLGNTGSGIIVRTLSTGNTIGGPTAAHGNVIGHADTAVVLQSDSNVVQSNFIGVSRTGTPLPTSSIGLFIAGGSGNLIGGTAGQGNRIRFTGLDGIRVTAGGRRNSILGNSIANNGSDTFSLGIDLDPDGLTPNDTGDGDTGTNDLQNHPVLTSATFSSGSVTIIGRLNSKPSGTYRLEFFSNAVTNRFSEGDLFLGTIDVTTDSGGNAQFTATFLATAGPHIISATATDSEGNTSEFGGLPDRLLNISTRLPVLGGDNVLIGGFIITGSANKRVLLRAIGPSLEQLFTDPVLQDTTLELFQGNTLLMSNDNWRDSQQSEIQNTGIPPSNELESAIVRDLAPGAYTAIVRGKNGGTGIGLVEAYDLERGTDAKFANIATRGFVQAGDNVMIAGFIVGGESRRGTRVVVRGIGPSLTNVGVPNALQNPTLQLVDGFGTVVAGNDNWRESQEAEIQASGLAPSNDNESAILASVSVGAYTAIVRGVNNTTGVALVEVYQIE